MTDNYLRSQDPKITLTDYVLYIDKKHIIKPLAAVCLFPAIHCHPKVMWVVSFSTVSSNGGSSEHIICRYALLSDLES